MAEGMKEFFVGPVLGSMVRCLVRGTGKPVVFVSGWLGTAENFIPLVEAFPRGYRCVAIDLPGFGKSTRMNGRHTVANYAEFLERFAKEAELKDPFWVGISLGASVVLARSLKYGNQKDVAVLQSPAYQKFGVDLKARCEIWAVTHLKFLTKVILGCSRYPLFKRMIAFLGDRNVRSVSYEYLARYGLESLYATDVGVLMESLEDIMAFNVSNAVGTAKGKFLLIYGSEENLFTEGYLRNLCLKLPGCQFKVVEGATHYAMLQKPEEFARLVSNFFK